MSTPNCSNCTHYARIGLCCRILDDKRTPPRVLDRPARSERGFFGGCGRGGRFFKRYDPRPTSAPSAPSEHAGMREKMARSMIRAYTEYALDPMSKETAFILVDAALDELLKPTEGMSRAAIGIDRTSLRYGTTAELLGRCMATMIQAAKEGK